MTDTRTTSTSTPPPPPESGARPLTEEEEEAAERRKGYLRLAVIVIGGTFASIAFGVGATVVVVLAFILMIMLHELGHYLTAKWAGMKVTEFFLGFGPRVWSVKRGETEYGIKAIPAGGYVKIIGMSNLEEVPPEDEPRTYRQKSYGRRMSVAVAGSTMHFLIAFVLLFVVSTFIGTPVNTTKVESLSELANGQSPAQEAGFEPGDEIVEIDGKAAGEWEDIRAYLQDRPEKPVRFVVLRDGQERELTAVPVDLSKVEVKGIPKSALPSEPTGFVGIAPTIENEKTSVLGGVPAAGRQLWEMAFFSVKSLGTIFSPGGLAAYTRNLSEPQSLSGDPQGRDEPRFTSPVGLVRVASQAADEGIREVLILLILINVFVGIFNMVPLPPLDGGHVAIATYERIRSRNGRRHFVDMAKVLPLTYAVFLVILLMGVTSIFLDIVRPAANPFQ